MRIGVPKETAAGEHRVALVPEVVSKLKAKGLDVMVQAGAGAAALLPDHAFADAGASIAADAAEVWASDLVVVISPPSAQDIQGLRPGDNSQVGGFNDSRVSWAGFSSAHPGMVYFCFGDASVRAVRPGGSRVRNPTSQAWFTFQAMAGMQDGYTIDGSLE